ncbi:dynamin family protein [Karstenula rhodostoma CBS 690.94]|uniref:Dynamin family protein n=1 Tax=Karstenula rhodostoma CBS 690.94 TaxID=1392251 RepID=A0A9P4P951_9PLEO|nr:dynamin family protein [Karstenula rhodostoma CBS 690.94]
MVALRTDILDQLCSEDQLKLLDAIDGLRSQGIDSYVSLPQIIVCGDQSSGKSSVLEAISGVSFPVKSNLCTRFPTELVLRKTSEISVGISIVPDASQSDCEARAPSSLHEKLNSFKELPQLIEKAQEAMAISTVGKAFSKDRLRIEISGPDRPHLTIVDLPGLIHSETRQQSASDIELVQDVVRSYMKEPRSIILAVISAKNDYANQIVLKLARAADKKGDRTLGIVTKPDTLVPGSTSERAFVSLARNQDVDLRLGWHVLRNLDTDVGGGSLGLRDTEEKKFFSEGVWNTLPRASLGVEKLRERLSALLLAQIAAELPSLMEEIRSKLDSCKSKLEKLGEPRATLEEQRLYLLQLSETCQSITRSAVDGSYNHPFFGDATSESGYQKRLRAVIQNLNESFAKRMLERGHKYEITDSTEQTTDVQVTVIGKSAYMDHIEHVIRRTRGRELPGTYNSMVIADLFVEQSQPWPSIVKQYSDDIAQAIESYLHLLVVHISDQTTCERLFEVLFKPALYRLKAALEIKLTELLVEHRESHPVTYNHHFIESVDELGATQLETEFTSIIKDFFAITSLHSSNYTEKSDFRPLLSALVERTKPIIARPACSKALDCMKVYYKLASERFVDVASVEAVEATLVVKIHEILRPLNVALMSADEVAMIAGESEESRYFRKERTTQIHVLTEGMKTCAHIVSLALDGNRSMKGQPSPRPHSIRTRHTPPEEEQPLMTRSTPRTAIPAFPSTASASPSANTASSGEKLIFIEPYECETETNLSQDNMPIASGGSRKKDKKMKRRVQRDEE